ncbi:MAG: multicopper oxidase domain-containing protein [Synechococcales cyanobacterium T60_A2020_003]|nr:multicopper oxidase domain-containing protein [Synechococcales cyanobacterium T60_A2020_003]
MEFFTQPAGFNAGVSRRDVIRGLGGLGAVAIAAAVGLPACGRSQVRIPPVTDDAEPFLDANGTPWTPLTILREFNSGELKKENGRTVREFRLTANSTPIQLNTAISYMSWNLNGRVPAPTLRATEGDRVRIIFENADGHSHSLHFHGSHPAEMDGVDAIRHSKTMVYEFDATPAGVHPYHCHVAPVTRHISKGLYGVFIIDPPKPRPPADEMVMVMGGYDINDDQTNELYAFNGIPNYYRDHPIPIYQHQLVRLYLLNMIEFDPAVTFHLHANLFQVYQTGRSLQPDFDTDVITMGTAERHILEFAYPYSGQYMFHPHQDYIAEQGCMGLFEVVPLKA